MSAKTYASYLQLDPLLSLQRQDEPGYEHDQMLFIVIHQVYELWFKTILYEMDYLARSLRANDASHALHTLRRILTILKTCVAQIDVLETMTPQEFLSFRDKLDAASGFQSFQFREIEFFLGYKRKGALANYEEGSAHWRQLLKRYQAPTLWDAFLYYLNINGHTVPAELLERDVTEKVEASPALQRVLLELYRQEAGDVRVCERLVDLDEGFQEWRYRHVKMVERTIGGRTGTGGSSGVGYLAGTLFKPFFPDLWAIRSEL
ncbi:MAG TPA: tryptophan 2,3-dioxygenase family protein [Anaerolineales bacterium]|nr:tryptophan 2,3-dioxygenase family protein [Anaerolineales bacterium]